MKLRKVLLVEKIISINGTSDTAAETSKILHTAYFHKWVKSNNGNIDAIIELENGEIMGADSRAIIFTDEVKKL